LNLPIQTSGQFVIGVIVNETGHKKSHPAVAGWLFYFTLIIFF